MCPNKMSEKQKIFTFPLSLVLLITAVIVVVSILYINSKKEGLVYSVAVQALDPNMREIFAANSTPNPKSTVTSKSSTPSKAKTSTAETPTTTLTPTVAMPTPKPLLTEEAKAQVFKWLDQRFSQADGSNRRCGGTENYILLLQDLDIPQISGDYETAYNANGGKIGEMWRGWATFKYKKARLFREVQNPLQRMEWRVVEVSDGNFDPAIEYKNGVWKVDDENTMSNTPAYRFNIDYIAIEKFRPFSCAKAESLVK